MLRFAHTLALVVAPLLEHSAAVGAGQGSFEWRTAEAALFCVRSVEHGAACNACCPCGRLLNLVA